ncbi:MAG TPA: FAD-dependent oxidoreductase [Candidatus Methylomirabilis sp.]|nr:FAD-dependent oxidoreductase [Candidatus Methylomirabilis sp.]
MNANRRKSIVILGGGFGGVYTAMELERPLKRERDIEITLINRENYLVFQPMLSEVISGSIGILDTVIPIRRLCPGVNLFTREVEAIDLDNKVITTSPGFWPQPRKLEYDYLVLALGTVMNFAGMPGLEEHAVPFKTLGDALFIRNHILHILEEADIEEERDRRQKLLTFVVAGGGFSGVEAVAEINDFAREAAKSYRQISPNELRVVLLHAGPRILPELTEDLGHFAQRILERRKVEIRLNTRLAGATGDYALLQGGERIPTKTLISTVPSAPHPVLTALPCRKEKGRIVTNEFLELPEFPGVWALGDCAWIIDRKSGHPCPPTAHHAIRQARCAAANIAAAIRGMRKRPFAFSGLGKMGALGRHSAVADILGVKVSGYLAWLLRRFIYLMKLPGLDRKLRVATDWFLDMTLPMDIVQLKITRSASISQEHFEPGETIFRQGDWGDRVYVIVKGEVEVVREEPGKGEIVLRKQGPGEYFGEIALISNAPRTATVRTLTGVDALTIERGAFIALLAHLPPLRKIFEQVMQERLERTTERWGTTHQEVL